MAAPTSSTSSSGRSAGIASVLAVAIIAAGGWASLVSQAAPTPTSPVPSRTATISPSVIVIGAMQRPFADQSDGGDGDHRPAVARIIFSAVQCVSLSAAALYLPVPAGRASRSIRYWRYAIRPDR